MLIKNDKNGIAVSAKRIPMDELRWDEEATKYTYCKDFSRNIGLKYYDKYQIGKPNAEGILTFRFDDGDSTYPMPSYASANNWIFLDGESSFLHKSNITNLKKKTIIAAGKYENVFINDVRINSPFILLVVEETYGVHIGRKSLKYNNKIKWNDCNNEKFYSKAQELFGDKACWFVHDISIRNNNELHFSAIKVSDEVLWYIDSKERQASWRILI
jgi:hypothetical protein